MSNLLEISLLLLVVLAIPAALVYWIVRSFIKLQDRTIYSNQLNHTKSDTFALRLQAYERLSLFVERIHINQVLLRVNHQDMDAKALKNSLILTIQKEYEHNLTQQIYVSGQLWQMISLLKDQTIDFITQSYLDAERQGKQLFINTLLRADDQLSVSMTNKVMEAIRKEVAIYFN